MAAPQRDPDGETIKKVMKKKSHSSMCWLLPCLPQSTIRYCIKEGPCHRITPELWVEIKSALAKTHSTAHTSGLRRSQLGIDLNLLLVYEQDSGLKVKEAGASSASATF